MWEGINRILKDHLKGKLKAESSQFNPFIGVQGMMNFEHNYMRSYIHFLMNVGENKQIKTVSRKGSCCLQPPWKYWGNVGEYWQLLPLHWKWLTFMQVRTVNQLMSKIIK